MKDKKHIKSTNESTENLNTSDVIGSDSFQKAIKKAFEKGICLDWGYDGEDEFSFETFDSDKALQEVIKVLKEHLL